MEEVSSTNDYLKELLSNIKPLAEVTAIMAKHQTQGRGQRGSVWLTPPDENLTFSFNLYPNNLDVSKSFTINMLLCLAIRRWLAAYDISATVKWPNDIYIHDRKIGGVLIENQLSGSRIRTAILGIGLNINQLEFPVAIEKKATSLRYEKKSTDPYIIEECCLDLLEHILALFNEYSLDNSDLILENYNKLLFRKNIRSSFSVNGQKVEGIIIGADASGKLHIQLDQSIETYDLKEISFII